MTDTITLTGLVATTPRHLITSEGLPITSFRLASTQRRFDRTESRWVDGDTNWYTITAFRQLAINAAGSVAKGERVVVTGRLRIRDWSVGEKVGTTVEIDADAIGHDLSWGSTVFTRSVSTATREESAEAPAETEPDSDAAASELEPTGVAAPF
ncbi:hypothetical protein BH09ACT3_BH09ACT3_13700 [soil metagenome]